MRTLIVLVACVFAFPAFANCWPYCDQQDSTWESRPAYQPPIYQPPTYQPPVDMPEPQPYLLYPNEPTLLNPQPYPQYPKEPTLGDPRPYRETDPRTCTSLLCD